MYSFMLAMKRNKRNPPIRLEVEGVIMGYDHIVSYMSSKHRLLKVDKQLAEKLAT